ncbi:MAG TPA: OsmC family protein [Longimicrobiales bacterium]
MTIATSKHSILATAAGGLAFDVAVRGHTIATDQTVRSGGADAAPTPLELMGAALAACVALYARKYCLAQGLDGDGIAVEVKPVWREDPGRVGRYDVVVHLPAGFPAEHRDGLMAMAADCPVHHTLAHSPELAFRVAGGDG